MTPYQARIAQVVAPGSRRSGAPAPSARAAWLGRKERITRHHLRIMEQAHLVSRPDGRKSGWKITPLNHWFATTKPGEWHGFIAAVVATNARLQTATEVRTRRAAPRR
jgi:hypothetical protein